MAQVVSLGCWECIPMVQQRQDMYLELSCNVIILSLIPVSVFPWLVRKSTILNLQMKRKKNVLVFFLQYGQISCVSKTVLGGSALWDNTEYMCHFPKTIHVHFLRKVRQHKSGIFGYSNSETIQINTWWFLFWSLLHCCVDFLSCLCCTVV
jgi:hypothetical protein